VTGAGRGVATPERSRDGQAWLLTTSYGGEDELDPVLRFAGHELLLKIVP
jgi:hypothetical protein